MKCIAVFLIFIMCYSVSWCQVRVLSVQSRKVHYLPYEKAVFTGEIENQGSKESDVTVHYQLVRRVNDIIDIGSRVVTIPPKSKSRVEFTYQLDGVEYGYEVQMWLDDESKKIREFFGVSRNVIKIGIFGDSEYQNYTDTFSWAPDDFGDLTPEGETWWSGMANYDMSRKELTEKINGWHSRGIKALTYGQAVSGGPPGIDLLIEHPDWACYNLFGQLGGQVMALDVWSLKYWSHNQHLNDKGVKWHFWNAWTVNFYNPETVLYGAKALVEGADMWGWDGVRFDALPNIFGGYAIDGSPTDRGENRDKLNTRNLKIEMDYIRQTYPDFIFGFNYGSAQSPPTSMDSIVCKGGGLIMDEGITNASDPQDPDNPWRKFSKRIIREVVNTAKAGGCQIIFHHNRGGQPVIADEDYGQVFCFAGGGRPYVWHYKSTRYKYDQFATRYSEYLMNDDIERLKNPDKIFTVRSSGEIWWRDWAAQYKPDDGKLQYIVHLINAPPKEGIGETPFPEKQKDIIIEVRLPDGQKLKDVWLLSPEPEVNELRLKPKPSQKGTVFTLEVDELDLWKFLVINTGGVE